MLIDYAPSGNPTRVIADDDRDPDVSWENHLKRTKRLRGGVDLVAKVGTPIYATTDGWVRRRPKNGSAGNSMFFEHEHNPGWGDVFSHLSKYVGEDDQYFKQGELIAFSGDSGGVTEHLHWHLERNGLRYNPWHYFSSSSPAANIITFITSGDDDMRVFANTVTDAWAVGGAGVWHPVPSGEGGHYEAAFGARVPLTPDAFTRAAAACLSGRSAEYSVYANVSTDEWAAGGPGFWYPIPGGEGALWEAKFGNRKAVTAAEFERMRVAFSR